MQQSFLRSQSHITGSLELLTYIWREHLLIEISGLLNYIIHGHVLKKNVLNFIKQKCTYILTYFVDFWKQTSLK